MLEEAVEEVEEVEARWTAVAVAAGTGAGALWSRDELRAARRKEEALLRLPPPRMRPLLSDRVLGRSEMVDSRLAVGEATTSKSPC